MPRATVTSRVLKNKDTGIELHVPTYKQTKESLLSVVHYQVVIVSNLACFKTPSHKESDVVQFSIEKKLNQFEELRNKLSELYPGTILPPIIKKSIIVNDVVLRERRNSLDQLMKFVACTPRLSICIPILTFLGVDKVRATKFSRGEPLENKTGASEESQNSEIDGEIDSQDPIVFGEDEDSGNEDFFGDDDENIDDTNDMFGSDDKDSRSGAFKVFEGQDLKRDLTEEDEDEFSFVPNAILTKKEVLRQPLTFDEEDNSDLLQIENDFDALMNVGKGDKKTTASSTSSDISASNSDQNTSTKTSRPEIPTKPSIPSKPSKPKPQIARKPNVKPAADSPTKPNLAPKPKPSVPSKSRISTSNPEPADSDAKDGLSLGVVENLGQDDIMKYLQDNLDSNADDVDLFS